MTTGVANKGKEEKAAFPHLEPVSLAEGVVAALKDAFFSGVLKPGAVVDPPIYIRRTRERPSSDCGVGT